MSQYHGSADWTVFLVDGCDMLGAKPKGVTWAIAALNERTDGLGDRYEALTPTGLAKFTLTQMGAIWDTTIGSIHDTFKMPSTVPRTVLLAPAGSSPGAATISIAGVVAVSYAVVGVVGQLTKADVTYQVNGPAATGALVSPYATHTVSWDTTPTPADNGAATANGATITLHVSAVVPPASTVVVVKSSPDGTTWTTLDTFAAVTTAPTVITHTLAGAIPRYLAVVGTITGAGSITCAVTAART